MKKITVLALGAIIAGGAAAQVPVSTTTYQASTQAVPVYETAVPVYQTAVPVYETATPVYNSAAITVYDTVVTSNTVQNYRPYDQTWYDNYDANNAVSTQEYEYLARQRRQQRVAEQNGWRPDGYISRY